MLTLFGFLSDSVLDGLLFWHWLLCLNFCAFDLYLLLSHFVVDLCCRFLKFGVKTEICRIKLAEDLTLNLASLNHEVVIVVLIIL